MTAGRPPIPTNLKLLKGTVKKHRVNNLEPKPKTEGIKQPDYLSPIAAKHWPKMYNELKSAGIIADMDEDALAMYCEAYALWRDAVAKLTKTGTVIKSEAGYPIRSPYVGIQEKAFQQMKTMLVEFGMSPSSRAKVSVVEKTETPTGWDSF